MKKTQKILALILASAMTLGSLAACAPKATTPEAAPEAAAPAPEAEAEAPAAAPEAEKPAEAEAPAEATASADKPLEGKRLGVAHISLYDEWCAGVRDEFVAQAEALGAAECNVQDGNLNAETQQRQVEDFITKKYDMIFIDPVSPEGILPTLEKATAAGIPVIAFDSNTPFEDLVSYIAWDHGESGMLTGKYVADYARKNLGGKIDVAILAMLNAPHTAIRSEKFKESLLAELGEENVNIVFEQDFGESRDSANNIVANNIKKKIDIIWCAVDNAAMGARVALEAKGVTGTKIISAGAWGKEPFDLINNGDLYYMMCIGISPGNIVKDSLAAAGQYFAGDQANIAKRTDIELSVIDATNIADFMKYVK